MNAYRIYTRKIIGMDNRVWRLMFAIIVLPLGLLSYRVMNSDGKCTLFSFTVKTLSLHDNDIFYTGEVLSFTASTRSTDIIWNFGDNTESAGENVHHQFLKEGIYLIKASGNSLCATEKEIRILNAPAIVQTPDTIRGRIIGPSTFNTFSEQKFTYPGRAKSYVWSVQNQPDFGIKHGQSASFNFSNSGQYTLQVELDSDMRKRDYFDITVTEAPKKVANHTGPVNIEPSPVPVNNIPVTPKPAAPDSTGILKPKPVAKNINISNETFLIYLQKVQTKEMAMPQFEQYGIVESTPVVANSKEHQTFGWLCSEIIKKKKVGLLVFKKTVSVRIRSAQLQRINGVVSIIEVNYDYR